MTAVEAQMNMITNLKSPEKQILALEAELEKTSALGAQILAEVEQLAAAENEPETTGGVLRAVGATRAARNRLTKVEAKVDEIRARLAEARQHAAQRKLDTLRKNYFAAANKLIPLATQARLAFAAVLKARDDVQTAGFRAAYDSLPVPPNLAGTPMLGEDMLDAFSAALNPQQGHRPWTVGLEPQPIVKPAAPTRREESTPPPDLSVSSFFAGIAASKSKPAKRAPLREKAGEGERLFQVQRGMVDVPGKGTLQMGDAVALPEEVAMALARGGAGDFITAEDLAAVDAGAIAPASVDGELIQ